MGFSLRVQGVAAGFVILGLTVGMGAAIAQSGEAGTRAIPPTVSVAALRVPEKARQHLEKARQAAIAGNCQDEYEREMAKALEIAPEFSEAYLLRGAQQVAAQHYEAGIKDALLAQRFEPGIPWAGIVLASAYSGLQRYQDAFVILDNLHGKDLESWQAKYEMARAEIGRGDAEGALRWSGLALEAVPADRIEARLLRAGAFQVAHRWKEALAQMEIYLASDQPQAHRPQVLAAVEALRRRVLEEETGDLASR